MRMVQFALASAAALIAATTFAAAGPLDGPQLTGVGDFQTLSGVHATPLTAQDSAEVRGADGIVNPGGNHVIGEYTYDQLNTAIGCGDVAGGACALPNDATTQEGSGILIFILP